MANYHDYTTSDTLYGSPQKKSKNSKAPLCIVTGKHAWQKTATNNVELCTRSECGTVRMKVKGHWRHTQKVRGSLSERIHKAEQLAKVTQRRLLDE